MIIPKSFKPSAATLKQLVHSIGTNNHGTKEALLKQLEWDVQTAESVRARNHGDEKSHSEISRRPNVVKGGLKVLSIDMGIRNLAYLVGHVEFRNPYAASALASSLHDDPNSRGLAASLRGLPKSLDIEQQIALMKDKFAKPKVEILAWRRLALDSPGVFLEERASPTLTARSEGSTSKQDARSDGQKEIEPSSRTESTSLQQENKPPFPVDPYHPKVLSTTALNLLKFLLKHQPDVILIERQRHRSGGSSAVQEWTLRVNTLEAMLWSGLRMWQDQQQQSSSQAKNHDQRGIGDPSNLLIEAVSPSRVASFWCGGEDKQDSEVDAASPDEVLESKLPAKPGRKRIEKSDKIAVVADWLRAAFVPPSKVEDSQSATASSPKVSPVFTLTYERDTREQILARCAAFVHKADGGRSSGKKTVEWTARFSDEAVPIIQEVLDAKIDDLADCFLQMATWVVWQDNKILLKDYFSALQQLESEDAKKAEQATKQQTASRLTDKSRSRSARSLVEADIADGLLLLTKAGFEGSDTQPKGLQIKRSKTRQLAATESQNGKEADSASISSAVESDASQSAPRISRMPPKSSGKPIAWRSAEHTDLSTPNINPTSNSNETDSSKKVPKTETGQDTSDTSRQQQEKTISKTRSKSLAKMKAMEEMEARVAYHNSLGRGRFDTSAVFEMDAYMGLAESSDAR